MARARPPSYNTEGFAGAHQARGLNAAARKFLESKGALPTPEEQKGKSAKGAPASRTNAPAGSETPATEGETSKKTPRSKKASASSSSSRSSTAPKDQGSVGQELPRRNRKARSLQARHFRLPLDIDAKLQELSEHYDATMVWVISKLIQDDWVRARRSQRRVDTDPGEADAPADSSPKDALGAEIAKDPSP